LRAKRDPIIVAEQHLIALRFGLGDLPIGSFKLGARCGEPISRAWLGHEKPFTRSGINRL